MSNNSGGIEGGLVDALKRNSRSVMGVGILVLIVGFLAVAAPLATGMAITVTVGIFLIIGGAAQCVLAFQTGAFGSGLLVLLTGLVTVLAGFYMVSQPVVALASITLILAAYFLVTGVLAIIAAVQIRPVSGWGWMLANGVITLLLGWMLFRQWPLSGAWAVGVLFGVQLISTGATLLAIGGAGRSVAKEIEG